MVKEKRDKIMDEIRQKFHLMEWEYEEIEKILTYADMEKCPPCKPPREPPNCARCDWSRFNLLTGNICLAIGGKPLSESYDSDFCKALYRPSLSCDGSNPTDSEK